jgi:hypothetical protein
MDFIGPLKLTFSGCRYIWHGIDYFSRYSFAHVIPEANVTDTIGYLGRVFGYLPWPAAVYCDRGQHFDNEEMRAYLGLLGTIYEYSPSGALKLTGLVENRNYMIEKVIAKGDAEWDMELPNAVYQINVKVIEHLKYSPSEILIGVSLRPLPI